MADALERECRAFCRYLVRREPPAYVLERYAAAHASGVVEPTGGSSTSERRIVALARRGSFWARALDARARILAPGSLLRRKLVLLLALLECSPETEADVDTVTHSGRAGLCVHLAALGVGFVLWLLAGLVVAPLAFVLGGGGADA